MYQNTLTVMQDTPYVLRSFSIRPIPPPFLPAFPFPPLSLMPQKAPPSLKTP